VNAFNDHQHSPIQGVKSSAVELPIAQLVHAMSEENLLERLAATS
jgi:hypothetical protein